MSLIRQRQRKGQQKQKFTARPGVEAKKAKEAEEAARQRRRSTILWTSVFVVGVAGLAALGFAMNVFNPSKYPHPENHAADNSADSGADNAADNAPSPRSDPAENGAG